MVAARIFGHILKVPRPWQGFEHLNGHVDMMIDDLALGRRQRACSHCQILDFIAREKIRLISIDVAPGVFGRDLSHALLMFGTHRLAAEIAEPQKFAILIDFPHLQFKSASGSF